MEQRAAMSRRQGGGRERAVKAGAIGLVLAGLVVAIAISTDGALSRGINGIGALVWLAATVALVVGLRDGSRWWPTLALAAAVTAILSFVVEPTSVVTAVPGFALGGAALAAISARPVAWALVVPALWLPVHLLTAVLPAILRAADGGEASVRTDPPPTAAIVPVMMILSAGAAGWLVSRIRAGRGDSRPVVSVPR